MTQFIFGASIDYSKPKIRNRPFVAQGLFTAVAPNGDIYVRGDGTAAGGIYRSDYSVDPNIYVQALFIHEMTHVWQHQVGMSVMLRGIINRNYDYDFSTFGQIDFKDYSIEEMASIVEDFFLLTNGAHIYRRGAIVSNPPPLQTYGLVTGAYFP